MQYPPPGQPQGQYQQQPSTYHPEWPGYQPPPLVQPPPAVQVNVQAGHGRKRPPVGWVVVAILTFFGGLFIGIGVHGGATTPTTTTQATTGGVVPTHAATTPTVAHTPTWTTTHTFTGNGSKKTETFAAPGDWKINWTCDPASFAADYNVVVGVTGSDNTLVDPAAINTICKAGNTSGSTEERQGGSVFLDVTSEGAWTITVQELK